MPNPRPDLAGWADRSEPGWEQRLLDRVAEHQQQYMKGRRHRISPLRACHLDLTHAVEFAVLLREAADARGLPRSSYARRAVAAFLAHDTGVPFERICQMLPSVGPPGGPKTDFAVVADDGEGYGPWHIERLA